MLEVFFVLGHGWCPSPWVSDFILRLRYFPSFLAKRTNKIPVYAIITMASLVFCLVLADSLKVILEFGSITFLLVSLLMAYANYKIRHFTGSSAVITLLSLLCLVC